MNKYQRMDRKRTKKPEPPAPPMVPAGVAPVRPGGRGPSMPERTAGPGAARTLPRPQNWADMTLAGAAFAFFLMAASHKLSNSSLWFDEAIEYWYSKVWSGTLPFSQTTGMYERIITTLQPPLYNLLMFLWLRVSDTEWWFRFFGVICGLAGMIGLWKTIRKAGGKAYVAAGAVCACACCYRMTFYWQEAAEYCLMMGALFWTVYYWTRVAAEPGLKNIILFTVCAIIPVYSQYGAAFPVIALCLSAPVCVLLQRNFRALIELAAAYAVALFCAGLPLYTYFLRYQLHLQHGGAEVHELTFENGFLRDFFGSLYDVFHWILTPDLNVMASRILLGLALLCTLVLLIWGRRTARALAASNILAYFFYYFAVKIGVYADMNYGGFGNRYNLFFLPMWISLGFVGGLELFHILTGVSRRYLRGYSVQYLFAGIAAAFLACFSYATWNDRIQPNWVKDDIREVVYHWYQRNGAAKNTIVYYAADGGFSYYVRMNPDYTEETENTVHYMSWYNDRTGAEYRTYLDGVFGTVWPTEVYVAADHYADDLFAMLDQFAEQGYQREDIYNMGGGCLIHLTRPVVETVAEPAEAPVTE